MKSTFEKLRKLSATERKKLLETATIVFDTNALLQLYRYSDDTRKSAFDIIRSYNDRVFEPFQVCFEFYRLKDKVINEEKAEVKTLSDNVKNFFDKTLDAARDGWIFKNVLKEAKQNILKEIEKIGKNKADFSKKDSVLDFCMKIFSGKISNSPSAEEKLKLCDIAKKRYEHKIAPGYRDSEKQYNPYGDYFIWHDIINYAKENKKDIIFVSNDVKSDWVEKGFLKDELIIEFQTETGQKIDYYTFETFLKNSANNNEDVSISRLVTKELNAWKKTIEDLNAYQMELKKYCNIPNINEGLKKNLLIAPMEQYDEIIKKINLAAFTPPALQELSEYSRKIDTLRDFYSQDVLGINKLKK